jgi:hypothetical protein
MKSLPTSSYFGLRISDFGFFCFPFSIRIPQYTIRNLEAGLSGRAMLEIQFILRLLGEK